MRAINVYASHTDHLRQRAPVCSDASEASRRMGPGGSWVGAAGWHFAFTFSTLADLAQKLNSETLPDYIRGDSRTLQRGEVQTLAIDCHGSDGTFYPNGVSRTGGVTASNLNQYGEALREIGLMTASQEHEGLVPNPPHGFPRQENLEASTIILMCCNTGAGDEGSELLRQLSYRWPNRRVVGFSTTVVFPNLQSVEDPATGETCVAPFGLDSGQHGMRAAQTDAWMQDFRESHAQSPGPMPFADATAANAKIARNGRIIDRPANEGRRASLDTPIGPPRGHTARPTRTAQARRRIV